MTDQGEKRARELTDEEAGATFDACPLDRCRTPNECIGLRLGCLESLPTRGSLSGGPEGGDHG